MPTKETVIPTHWGNEAQRLITNGHIKPEGLGIDTEADLELFRLTLAKELLGLDIATCQNEEWPFPLGLILSIWKRIKNPRPSFIPKFDLAIKNYEEKHYLTDEEKRRARDIRTATHTLISRATGGMERTTLSFSAEEPIS